MKPSTVETWVWVLLYGGLLMVSVGVFVRRGGAPGLAWTLIAVGGAAAAAGAALVVVRARMTPPEASPRRPPP
ncbi:MAG: hypothetical protein C0505_13765 [Leptothrix sp. (in: Bacteria)]|nr:hypothetical protein [Leptothrix sp. (in: b-proteobacteria)]